MFKVIFVGRLCAEPEMRTTQAGVSVCNMRLALRTNFKNGDGEYVTEFCNAAAWRGLADICIKHLHKGDMVSGTGDIRKREYDGTDGQKHTVLEINIESMELCGGRSANPSESASSGKPSRPAPTSAPKGPDKEEDDLPF